MNSSALIIHPWLYKRAKPIVEAQQFQKSNWVSYSVVWMMLRAVLGYMCSEPMEWSVPMWCANLHLRKAFHRIEYDAFFDVLQRRQFPIKHGVKQGDVLNPLLIDAGLEYAMRQWQFRVEHCRMHGGDDDLLTNVCYADHMMLYARKGHWSCKCGRELGCRIGTGLFPFEYFQDQNFDNRKFERTNVPSNWNHCAWNVAWGQKQMFGPIMVCWNMAMAVYNIGGIQLEALRNLATVIQIQEANPKKLGSKAFERFGPYKTVGTIRDATSKGRIGRTSWVILKLDIYEDYCPHAFGCGGTRKHKTCSSRRHAW